MSTPTGVDTSKPVLRRSSGPGPIAGETAPPAVFTAVDPRLERLYLHESYGTALSIDGFSRGTEVRHRRGANAGFTMDEITIVGSARVSAHPEADVMVAVLRNGTLRIQDEVELHIAEPLLAHGHLPWTAWASNVTLVLITIAPWMIRRACDEQVVRQAEPVRELTARPPTAALVTVWNRSLDYVNATAGPDAGPAVPLMVDACGRLLAAAALSCFVPHASTGGRALRDPTLPVAMRRAMVFITANAREEIGINEIAEAVHLSPRAVQYLFRKHLQCTPTEYLRQVRMHRAHNELLSSDRATTTVADVARRWGFCHTGRFAVLYRQIYGISPHRTLRG